MVHSRSLFTFAVLNPPVLSSSKLPGLYSPGPGVFGFEWRDGRYNKLGWRGYHGLISRHTEQQQSIILDSQERHRRAAMDDEDSRRTIEQEEQSPPWPLATTCAALKIAHSRSLFGFAVLKAPVFFFLCSTLYSPSQKGERRRRRRRR